MDQEQWSPNYQQSVTTGMERTSSSTNKSNTDSAAVELTNSQIKEDPDAKTAFPHIKSEFNLSCVAISEKSRQTIQAILSQIKLLSQNDKYLLYLKLPFEITDITDPFRQPLNPLGSRSEISRTIAWIQTHLEENQTISLPKKEVYNEYELYCVENNIKPLSQADFGKVMKQVFPKVRARRLGQRGNSKYCYSGLTRRSKLEAPLLPDLVDKPLSTEPPLCQTSVIYAAWLVVRDWAQQILGVQFPSIQALAHYLVRNCSVNSGSDAATKLTINAETPSKGEEPVSKNNKHREMQLQLQKKLQQKNEVKERKRKIQTSKQESKPGTKKCRSASVPASTITNSHDSSAGDMAVGVGGGLTSGECSTASSSCGSNSISPTQGRTICDKPEFTQLTALPDFKSFQKPAVLAADGVLSTTISGGGKDKPVSIAATSAATPVNLISSKVAIPRLQQTSPKGSVSGQAKVQQHAAAAAARKAKYKSIQPRLQPCDIATYNAPAQQQPSVPVITTSATVTATLPDTRSQLVQNVQHDNVNDKITENKCADNLNECEDDEDFPLTRERLDSISNVEKDAMDEYLGTNNSQHEEELSKYFNANGEAEISTDIDHNTKISTLRQLLEQNGISEKRPLIPAETPISTTNITLSDNIQPFPSPITSLSQISRVPFVNSFDALSKLPSLNSNTRRRVSFETTVAEDSVPPSPNTRSKNFNFTPISPGPHSPNGVQSKCSSSNASPFVSPRNTPVPRSKNTTHQNAGIMLQTDVRKHTKVKKELDLTMDIAGGDNQHLKNYMPMSAPVSPMLANDKSMLKTLLNANSKVQYTPEYTTGQNIPPTADSAQFFPDLLSRSQSVPLGQMQGFTTLAGNPQIITEIMKRDPEFHNLPGAAQRACDNNNIDFSLVMSSSNQCLPEYGLNLINTCESGLSPYTTQKIRNITRSQSIDVDSSYDVTKCNPSRSVPSTPLPFTQNLKINVMDNNKSFPASSRSYPSTPLNSTESFVYQGNSDCLINGQPIRTESGENNIGFISSFELSNDAGGVGHQLENDFGIMENGEDLMDDSGILISHGFNGNIN